MKKVLGIFLFSLVAWTAFGVSEAAASQQAVLKQTSNVRSTPIVRQGNIATVLPVGTQVQILVQGQGWYLISKDYNLIGWIASWLVDIQEDSSAQTATAQPAVAPTPASTSTPSPPATPASAPPPSVATSTSLLDVDLEKTYGIVQLNSNLRTGPMQSILEVVPKESQVEILGESNSWYHVRTQAGVTGWIAGWLIEPTQTAAQIQTASASQNTGLAVAPQQVGVVPASIDTQELNNYWLAQVNKLRSQAGLRQLRLSQALATTAATWADYMGTIGQLTHARTDGSSMHEWAEAQGIPFAERYTPNGWDTNYFTENIGRHVVYATMDEAKAGLDRILTYFISENNGPHYRTVYHKDWNSVGSGFYFDPVSGGKYQMYAVFHYGSLAD